MHSCDTHTHTPCGYVDEVRDVRIVDCCLSEQLLQVRVARVLSQLLDYSVWACGGRGVHKNMKSCTQYMSIAIKATVSTW